MSGMTSTANDQLLPILENALNSSSYSQKKEETIVAGGSNHLSISLKCLENRQNTEKRTYVLKEKRCISTFQTKEQLKKMTQTSHLTAQGRPKFQKEVSEKNMEKKYCDSSNNALYYIEKKSPSKHLQVYTCFLCFLSNTNDCMWDNSQQYLAHISSLHKDFLDFENILKNRVSNFSGSHIFFKGKLTSILSNTPYENEFKLYYQLKNELFNQLYFCSCKVPSLQTDRIDMRQLPIFNSERNYIDHLKKRYYHQNNLLSHQLKQSGSKIFLKKNSDFDIDLQMDKVKESQNFMKIGLRSRIKLLTMIHLLKKIPINVLQIVSCNPGLVSPENISVPFPECQRCFQLFSHTKQLLTHRRKECTQSRYDNKYQFSKEDLKKLSLLKKLRQRKKQYLHHAVKLKNLFQLTQDESDILRAHLYLVEQNGIGNSWKAFICGHCKAVFAHSKKPYFDYLLHIYRQHQTLHPLNSHYIRFVQKLPKEMQEEDQEEDED